MALRSFESEYIRAFILIKPPGYSWNGETPFSLLAHLQLVVLLDVILSVNTPSCQQRDTYPASYECVQDF